MNEIFIQLQTCGGAFFRMKLRSENIITRYRTSKWRAIQRLASGMRRIGWHGVVTVHKIKVTVVDNALPQRDWV